MTQKARPILDISTGQWLKSESTAAGLYDEIDEVVENDSNFAASSSSPALPDVMEVKLGALATPPSRTGHIIRYAYKKDYTGGDSLDLTVRLMQGATEIAAWTHTNIDALTTAQQTLTTGQATAITDYSNLRLRFSVQITPVADPQFVGQSSAKGQTTSLLVDQPAGLAQGDEIIVAVQYRGLSITPDPMWTEIGSPAAVYNNDGTAQVSTLRVFQKQAGASEPAQYTWAQSGAQTITVVMTAYRNISPTAPVNVSASFAQSAYSASDVLPSVTPVSGVTSGILVQIAISADETSFTAPGGTTKRIEDKFAGGSLNGATIAVGDKLITSGAATGTQTWTNTNPNAYATPGRLGGAVIFLAAGLPTGGGGGGGTGGSTTLGSALPTRLGDSTGTEYFVNPATGNDTTGTGTSGAPWATLSKALSVKGTEVGAIITIVGSTNPAAPTILNAPSGVNTFSIGSKGSSNPANPVTVRAQPISSGGWVFGSKRYSCVSIRKPTGGGSTSCIWLSGGNNSLRFEGIDFTEGFTLTGNTQASILMYNQNYHIEIFNCRFHDTGAAAIGLMSQTDTVGAYCTDIWVVGCEFYLIGDARTDLASLDPTTTAGYYRRGTHPIYMGGTFDTSCSVDHRVRNVVIANNIFHDVKWGKETEIGNSALNVYFVNNTSYRHGQGASFTPYEIAANAGLGFVNFSSDESTFHYTDNVHIVNNVWKDAASNAAGTGQGIAVSNEIHNCIAHGCLSDSTYGQFNPKSSHTGTGRGFTKGANLIEADPLLVTPGGSIQSGANYKIGTSSPAKFTADPAYSLPVDFAGVARPSAPSMGALEP